MDADYLAGLTAAQLAAVQHPEGKPALVVAAPGSGKTRCITLRIVHLVKSGVSPGSIVAVTFTNKAANEMRSRLATLLPRELAKRIPMSTFHSLCARLLRVEATAAGIHPRYTICDEDDSESHVIQAICSVSHDDPKEIRKRKDWRGADYAKHFIESCKQRLLQPEDLLRQAEEAGQEDGRSQYLRNVYEKYQLILARNRALDFEDLISKVVLLLKQKPEIREKYSSRIKHLLVDEYQDTNHSQFELALLLSGHWHNLFVVGDSDQSIYGWRGADITNVTKLEERYHGEVPTYFLEENFRSTKSIAASANALIVHNTERKPKQILAVHEAGSLPRCVEAMDTQQEAAFAVDEIKTLVRSGQARYSDFAIIYRIHSRSRAYEELLVGNNIPHRIIGGLGFYNRAVVKDLLAYLKLVDNPWDDASFMRIYDSPPRGFGETSYYKMYELRERENKSFIELFRGERYRGILTGRPLQGAEKLKALFDRMYEIKAAQVGEILNQVVKLTGYEDHLESMDDQDTMQNRLDHLHEMLDAVNHFDQTQGGDLTRFLEWVALMQTEDKDQDTDKVCLLTCHAAKGLEFRHVYLIGAVEGTLPIVRNEDEDGQPKDDAQLTHEVEEERRVFYVGMTRAEETLTVSYSRQRFFRGSVYPCVRSRFLDEMEGTLETVALADTPMVGSFAGSKRRGKHKPSWWANRSAR